MKLTKKNLKEMIREVIKESYFSPDYSFMPPSPERDEEEALHKHRMAKRARGEYPNRPSTGGYEDTRSEEERAQAYKEAKVQAIKNILAMPMMAGSGISTDPGTYAAVEELAPELLDRLSVPERHVHNVMKNRKREE
jgi:hypothetical protein